MLESTLNNTYYIKRKKTVLLTRKEILVLDHNSNLDILKIKDLPTF